MTELESLETVAVFGLFTYDIKNGINKLRPLGVMTFGPVIASSTLTKDEVIRTK